MHPSQWFRDPPAAGLSPDGTNVDIVLTLAPGPEVCVASAWGREASAPIPSEEMVV